LKLAVFTSYCFMILILSCYFLFILKRCVPKGVGRKIFGGKGVKEHQDREIAPISLPPFISGGVEGALGMHPELISRERCTKSPA